MFEVSSLEFEVWSFEFGVFSLKLGEGAEGIPHPQLLGGVDYVGGYVA